MLLALTGIPDTLDGAVAHRIEERTALAGGAGRLGDRVTDALLFGAVAWYRASQPDPGYIRAYPPGLRENGGQYSHGAIWSEFALMQLGQVDEAVSLFNQLNPVNHARTPEDAARANEVAKQYETEES